MAGAPIAMHMGWHRRGAVAGAAAAAAVVLVCVDLQATRSIEALGEPLTRSEPG